ncbi:MAG: SPOR domain-containing protein [Bacteriovoracaceae bacterium]|nr:SPOR domain-containing protein [Bacteriovoracaceae bacterium]
MDEKTKLYVFTKFEVILIFILVILIAPTFFFIGLKLGISYSYKEAGLTREDSVVFDLESKKEESVREAAIVLKSVDSGEKKDIGDDSMRRIKSKLEDLDKLERETTEPILDKSEAGAFSQKRKKIDLKAASLAESPFGPKKGVEPGGIMDEYVGKYTIQLASYRKMQDADGFAGGFKVRGYNPIISNVELNAVTWFRVSLGSFETISEAKEYIKKEKELFRGTNYVISKFE